MKVIFEWFNGLHGNSANLVCVMNKQAASRLFSWQLTIICVWMPALMASCLSENCLCICRDAIKCYKGSGQLQFTLLILLDIYSRFLCQMFNRKTDMKIIILPGRNLLRTKHIYIYISVETSDLVIRSSIKIWHIYRSESSCLFVAMQYLDIKCPFQLISYRN